MSAVSAQTYQSLQRQYQALSELEKTIVRLLAVFYEAATYTDLAQCLNSLGHRDSQGKAFTVGTVKSIVEKLSRLQLAELKKGPACPAPLREIASRDAVKAGVYSRLADLVEQIRPISRYGSQQRRTFRHEGELIREARIGVYQQDLAFIEQQFHDFNYYSSSRRCPSLTALLLEMADNPPDWEWIASLSAPFLERVMAAKLEKAAADLTPAEESYELLRDRVSDPETQSAELALLLCQEMILRGELAELSQLLRYLEKTPLDLHPSYFFLYQGTLAFLKGEYEPAQAAYQKALASFKKQTRKRKVILPGLSGVFYGLLLIRPGTSTLVEAVGYLNNALSLTDGEALHEIYYILFLFSAWQRGDRQKLEILRNLCRPRPQEEGMITFLKLIVTYWLQLDNQAPLINYAQDLQRRAFRAGYDWVSAEMAELLSRCESERKDAYGKIAQEWRAEEKAGTILDLIKPQSDWELSLNALLQLAKSPSTAPATENAPAVAKRLAWFVTLHGPTEFSLAPREQAWSKKGEWTAGRAVALKRLNKQAEELDYLTPQDWRICGHLETTHRGYYGQVDYEFGDLAFSALVGHPYVFLDEQPAVQVEVIAGEPELLVKNTGSGRLVLELQPSLAMADKILVLRDGLTRLKVITLTPQHEQIATILGSKNRLEVPEAAQDQVLSAINSLASLVTIHSDIGGGAENAEELPASSLPHIHLLPLGGGLKAALLTRPFGEAGPYCQPGKGGATLITEINGTRYQTRRDLAEESRQAKAVIKACPTLALQDGEGEEWLLEDPDHCLELLLELQDLGEEVKVEWPEGEKLRVHQRAGFGQFNLNINRQRDWFAAEGELRIDDSLVLNLQQLMDLLEQSPGRFIPLADGQFVALTQEFRQRLEELKAFSDKQGAGRRFNPLAALALEDLFDEVEDLQADRHWREHCQRIREMKDLNPQVPSTLQAELRDYQLEGFQWLARLAHWGVGACLADDMGLGKTVQALALILTRAASGPVLIVAPTSVCPNWIAEARRFAPTLNPCQFGAGDRASALENLQPFDLVVCTYGLLQQEEVAELLAQVEWQVIVLDEAQAIKNMATKRSQAAMSLQAQFKMITTGTPIENHLGELWNLFRFINPGLLGSLESFNERFANPIERLQSKPARQQLRRLIQPFILRRTKSQVLQELPPRTEILLQVELSQQEMAFYEALRRQAVSKLENSEADPGAKHLQVLAEIMRLRRACCNPSLILPESAIPSSKLETFGEIVGELLENRHKALVFSQFVDHLNILRAYLDQRRIHYQYLDGSTPMKARQQRVEAFQRGEGDVFLISLKAGGTGLNLTAADYVIHMDPWWNPAVEDQASDRAHRIGQKRPVTIYRLVAKNTIEEKIVDLHHQKRDLADSLLEGADLSGKVSTEQLLALISGD
ncbi:MAG: DEAD/DEAH box helicase [Cyanobacteriota bacterium]